MIEGSFGEPVSVLVTRGGTVESVHRVHFAVADAAGRLVAGAGAVDRPTFYRSAAKPFQALPLVDDGVADALGMGRAELALCCASHNGEERHVEGVRRLLDRGGWSEDDLECGPHPPMDPGAQRRLARAGKEPGRVHNNCSGKHAGMLALAGRLEADSRGYVRPEHPVQRRVSREMARWSETEESAMETAIDGCGVVCFAVPLRAIAASYARLTARAEEGPGAARRIVEAMTGEPFLVAGSGRLCTVLMEAAGERVLAKTGAEGVYGAALRREGLGVALKVEDGARRAADVALVRILEQLGALGGDVVEGALSAFHAPAVRNTRGERVGALEARFDVVRA